MVSLGRWILAAALACLTVSAVFAADTDSRPVRARHHHHYYRGYLPPERHVIEVVGGARGYAFIINGAHFRAKTTACGGWLAGDRIKLLAGSWHAACVDAVFYNATRRRSCEMWCG
jgi:hypothetical protein